MRRPNLKADAAYENAHLITRDLLGRIAELLTDMPVPDAEIGPINWGHVGTMNEVNRQLSEVIEFLEN